MQKGIAIPSGWPSMDNCRAPLVSSERQSKGAVRLRFHRFVGLETQKSTGVAACVLQLVWCTLPKLCLGDILKLRIWNRHGTPFFDNRKARKQHCGKLFPDHYQTVKNHLLERTTSKNRSIIGEHWRSCMESFRKRRTWANWNRDWIKTYQWKSNGQKSDTLRRCETGTLCLMWRKGRCNEFWTLLNKWRPSRS